MTVLQETLRFGRETHQVQYSGGDLTDDERAAMVLRLPGAADTVQEEELLAWDAELSRRRARLSTSLHLLAECSPPMRATLEDVAIRLHATAVTEEDADVPEERRTGADGAGDGRAGSGD